MDFALLPGWLNLLKIPCVLDKFNCCQRSRGAKRKERDWGEWRKRRPAINVDAVFWCSRHISSIPRALRMRKAGKARETERGGKREDLAKRKNVYFTLFRITWSTTISWPRRSWPRSFRTSAWSSLTPAFTWKFAVRSNFSNPCAALRAKRKKSSPPTSWWAFCKHF